MVSNFKRHFSQIRFLVNYNQLISLATRYMKFVFPSNKELCDIGNLLGKS